MENTVRQQLGEPLAHGDRADRIRVAPEKKGGCPPPGDGVTVVGPFLPDPWRGKGICGPVVLAPVRCAEPGRVDAARRRHENQSAALLRVPEREADRDRAAHGLSDEIALL